MGCLSDPPKKIFYSIRRTGKDGLKQYYNCRGTSDVEGGAHQKIPRRFGAYNASPKFTCNLLAELRQRSNIHASYRHREGYIFYGNYNTWDIEELAQLETRLLGETLYFVFRPLNGTLLPEWP